MPREVSHFRSRSQSPRRHSHGHPNRHRSSRDRSRSPPRTHHHPHSRHTHKDSAKLIAPAKLPFDASSLSRHDLTKFRPMFALYLDIQKRILIEDLAEDEVKGRWKSFVGKWNGGKLAEGWYDPHTLEKAKVSNTIAPGGNANATSNRRPERSPGQTGRRSAEEHNIPVQDEHNDSDDDDFGPTLPQSEREFPRATHPNTLGPSIPKLHDLQHAHELAAEDAVASRKQASKDLHANRKAEQALRKSHLEEIIPRAEPGTRERQLEKRRELAASNRTFASAKADPTDVDLPETDVMGGEEGSGELKRMKEVEERKRSEREIRKEEVMRAKREEREERMREMKKKEEKTMDMLREIARVRFGGGGIAEGSGSGG